MRRDDMNVKRSPMTPREVVSRLKKEGWELKRKGPGDHQQFTRSGRPGRVTVDMGVREIPTGTLRSIFKQAGWEW
ncbi:type II toxin-antitoxin system HicA family toxin [Labrys sp. KB_33_2]|uniref:type II toxin-antitoxin system HicA family toxin n=1 Tax=Labrys sp. KB_33_2 TaxID=3237479 RepID=UPI003F92C391